jgi:hypothetical protein
VTQGISNTHLILMMLEHNPKFYFASAICSARDRDEKIHLLKHRMPRYAVDQDMAKTKGVKFSS